MCCINMKVLWSEGKYYEMFFRFMIKCTHTLKQKQSQAPTHKHTHTYMCMRNSAEHWLFAYIQAQRVYIWNEMKWTYENAMNI